jgi:hypothetical protein
VSPARALLLAAMLAGPALKWDDAGPAAGEIRVKITSATLGEEPGGFGAMLRASGHKEDLHTAAPKAASMQLSIVAATLDSSASFSVTKVEAVDDAGHVLGELKAQPPESWSTEKVGYRPWNERVSSGEKLSVSYGLTLAEWPPALRSARRSVVIRATVVIGGKERIVEGSTFSGQSGSVRG